MDSNENNYYTTLPKLTDARDESELLGQPYNRVCCGFSFVMQSSKETCSVTIHRGFLTNGSSLPNIARKLLKKWIGIDHPSIVMYDWLTEYLLIEVDSKCCPITRYDAMHIFLLALRQTKLSKTQLFYIYLLCDLHNLFMSNDKATLNPYKRYLEDKSYCLCN